jgi:hypothetical protein
LLMAQRSWPVWFMSGCVMLSSMVRVAGGICRQAGRQRRQAVQMCR